MLVFVRATHITAQTRGGPNHRQVFAQCRKRIALPSSPALVPPLVVSTYLQRASVPRQLPPKRSQAQLLRATSPILPGASKAGVSAILSDCPSSRLGFWPFRPPFSS